MGLVEKFGKKTLISGILTLVLSSTLIGSGASIDGESSGSNGPSSNTVTLYTGSNQYASSGTTTFSYYANNSGNHRIYINDIYDVSSFSIYSSSGSYVSSTKNSSLGYYEAYLNSYTTYEITVSSGYSYSIKVEYSSSSSNSSSSSSETLYTNEEKYASSGTTAFSYYANNSGYYRFYINDIDDVYLFSVVSSSGSSVSYDKYSEYYEVYLNSNTTYNITVSSSYSYYITVEYVY